MRLLQKTLNPTPPFGFWIPGFLIAAAGQGFLQRSPCGRTPDTSFPFKKTQNPTPPFGFWIPGFLNAAAGQGFEPRLPGPEPGVLPLDDPAKCLKLKTR